LTSARVDYDGIAAGYDQRFRDDSGWEAIPSTLLALAERSGAQDILEAGCGTGHWLSALVPTVGRCYGLDLSGGMLQQAQQQGWACELTCGRASQLPYRDTSFDLIYCVNALHHFERPQAFVSEARRLLRPAGALAVIGSDPHTLPGRWYLYDYFEGTRDADLARFPAWGTVLNWMLCAGLARAEWRMVRHIHDPKVGRAVLNDPFLQKHACSQLALLSDEAYSVGLRKIEAALTRAQANGETLTFPTDILVGMLVGWAPG